MNKKVLKRTFIALVCVIVAVIIFFAGYLVRMLTGSKWTESLQWAVDVIESKYYQDVEIDPSYTAINAIVDEYLDQYSAYYTKEEYAEVQSSNAGSREGIGVTSTTYGDEIHIKYVFGNSPAYSAGLRRGDTIVGASLNGSEETKLSSSSALSSLVSEASTDDLIRIYTDDGTVHEMYKAEYTAGYVFMNTNECGYSVQYDKSGSLSIVENEDDAYAFLPSGAAYVSLLQFYGNAPEEFGYMLKEFNALGLDTMYLDLRNNGGGYVSVMQELSGYFVSSGKTAMTAVFKNGGTSTYKVSSAPVDTSFADKTKLYVLANNGTASASEALLGVLISYGIIDYEDMYISNFSDDYLSWSGTADKNGRTYGKGIMQETIINTATGEALKLTTATIHWPNGNCIHGTGLGAEDGCVLVSADWDVTKGDDELQEVVRLTNLALAA